MGREREVTSSGRDTVIVVTMLGMLFVTEQFSSCPIVVKRYRVSFTGTVFTKDCMYSFSRRLSDIHHHQPEVHPGSMHM